MLSTLPDGSASVIFKDRNGNDKYWWVTGGAVSMVMDTNHEWFEYAIDGREERTEHCMVQIDCDTVAIIGGAVSGTNKAEIQLCDLDKLTCTKGPT